MISVDQCVDAEYWCCLLYHVLIFRNGYLKETEALGPMKVPSKQFQHDLDAEF